MGSMMIYHGIGLPSLQTQCQTHPNMARVGWKSHRLFYWIDVIWVCLGGWEGCFCWNCQLLQSLQHPSFPLEFGTSSWGSTRNVCGFPSHPTLKDLGWDLLQIPVRFGGVGGQKKARDRFFIHMSWGLHAVNLQWFWLFMAPKFWCCVSRTKFPCCRFLWQKPSVASQLSRTSGRRGGQRRALVI